MNQVQQIAVDLMDLLRQRDVPMNVGLAGLAIALVTAAGAMDEPYSDASKEDFMNALSSTWDGMRYARENAPTIN